MTLHVLHLEDNEADHELVARALRRSDLDCELQWVETLEDFEQALASGGFCFINACACSRSL